MSKPKVCLLAVCTLVTLAVLLVSSQGAQTAQQPTAMPEDRVLVGVNYFAGWWPELPNKWHGKGWSEQESDWRLQHPERDPLPGIYNDQATMDREIAAAAEHAVDFFAILWYYPVPKSKEETVARRLNRGLDCFLKSSQSHRLHFMVEYCNHSQFAARSDSQWEECVATWVVAMRHPSYLRVGGRPVFKFQDAGGFLIQNDRDVARCQSRIDALRQAVRMAGLGEMLIGGGIMSRSKIGSAGPIPRLFDFTATYMSVPPVEPRDEEYSYARLAEEARAARASHAGDPIPWVPYLATSWNPRPWTHPQAAAHHRTFFRFPTRAEWTDELRGLCEDFAKYPLLGLPLPGNHRQKVVTIYAWNEFGEGGILAPTKANGAMMLEAVRDVFGSGSSR